MQWLAPAIGLLSFLEKICGCRYDGRVLSAWSLRSWNLMLGMALDGSINTTTVAN